MTVDVSTCIRCARPIPADSPSRSCDACRPFLVSTPRQHGARTVDEPLPPTRTADTPTKSDAGGVDADETLPVVAGYDIHDEIAAGGGGRVYHATQRIAKRRVALKTLARGGNRARFEREVRALAAMDHPNIVRVYEVGECDQGPFFSMEFAAGGTLSDRLKRSGPMAAADAALVVEKAARGVATAHARGIGHRDIKPSNILLNAAGEPMVSDFGLAKEWHVEPSPDRSTADPKTAAGVFLGTPPYAAPEQAAGVTDEQDARTDVYGLGAVLYHALTGHPPFGGDSTATTLHRVLTQVPRPPRQRVKTIPRSLEAICLKCLEKKRDDRYSTAAELADDLARWRQGETPIARPVPRWKSAAGWASRNVAVVALAVLAAAAISLAVSPFRPGSRQQVSEKRGADPDAVLRQLAEEIATGKPVILIGETGRPRWWRFETGTGAFRDSRYGDFCSLESLHDAYVELLPASHAPPAYRLRADVLHESGMAGNSRTGVSFVRRHGFGPTGHPASTWLGVSFNDHPPDPPDLPGYPDFAVLTPGVTLQTATVPRQDWMTSLGVTTIAPPALGNPRVWRTIEVVVRSEAVLAWITDEKLGRQPLLPAVTTREALDSTARSLAGAIFGRDHESARSAAWSTAGAIGINVFKGHASFRNASIEQLNP